MGQLRIWAVEHLLGVALVVHANGRGAAKIAESTLGAGMAPYSVPRNQPQAILWARSRGAKVLNPNDRHNDETLNSANYFTTQFKSQLTKPKRRRRGAKIRF